MMRKGGAATRCSIFLIAAGLFLATWGARLFVIDRYGSDVPQTDQWYAEGERVLLPYQQGELRPSVFLEPHNEHRIACTRALLLSLFILNGQWDARLECVVNAAIFSVLAALAFVWAQDVLPRWWQLMWLVGLALFAVPPIAWENVVHGFHSQQYFVLLFSLVSVALLLTSSPLSFRWHAGAGCALLAQLSMASGLLAPVAVALTLAVTVRSRQDWRDRRITICACLLLALLGLLAFFAVPGENQFKARGVVDYLLSMGRFLQWQYERLFPFRNNPWIVLLAPLEWLPWFWLSWEFARRPKSLAPKAVVVVALGGWVLMHFAASSYSRGYGAPWVASRYVDTLVVGFAINALALLVKLATPVAQRVHRALLVASIAGAATTTIGLGIHVVHFFNDELPAHAEIVAARNEQLTAYLMSGDPAAFAQSKVAQFSVISLPEFLDQPEVRAILPASLQPPGAPVGALSRFASEAAEASTALFCLGIGLTIAGAALFIGRTAQRSAERPVVELEEPVEC